MTGRRRTAPLPPSPEPAPERPAADRSPTTVRARGLLPSLSPAEQRVAQVIIDYAATASGLTISDLADRAQSSETTVIRFCRAMGFSGYSHLRLTLAGEAGRASDATAAGELVGGDISETDELAQVVKKIAFADARAVEETAVQIDIDVLERVVDLVVGARRVDIYGVGASAFVAADFQQKLHRIGHIAYAWSDTHMALTSAALLDERDVAFGISHTGTTLDTIDAFAEAGRRGARTVALTNFPKSPIAAVADLVLTTAARETTFRSGATASRLAQLTVIDCVFVGVAQRTYRETRKALDATYEATSPRRVGPARRRG